jgi:hypothetical protein
MRHNGERNCCYKRQPLHVFEQDKQGYYTVQVYDPIASVISYLRDQRWSAVHSIHNESERIQSLLDAIGICNAIANGQYLSDPLPTLNGALFPMELPLL